MKMEVIEVMTAEQWNEYHIQVARAEARKRQIRWNEKHTMEKEQRIYFRNQKLYGIIEILLIFLLTLLIGDPCCLVLALPGFIAIFTKKMVIVNDYYWKHGGDKQWKI